MKLKMRLIKIFSSLFLLCSLASCDKVTVFDSYVSWRLINNSSADLVLKIEKGELAVKRKDSLLLRDAIYVMEVEVYDHGDTARFERPLDFCHVNCIDNVEGKTVVGAESLLDLGLWHLTVADGKSIPFEHSVFSEYDTWYDYTFTITDEMLEAARKGGGE